MSRLGSIMSGTTRSTHAKVTRKSWDTCLGMLDMETSDAICGGSASRRGCKRRASSVPETRVVDMGAWGSKQKQNQNRYHSWGRDPKDFRWSTMRGCCCSGMRSGFCGCGLATSRTGGSFASRTSTAVSLSGTLHCSLKPSSFIQSSAFHSSPTSTHTTPPTTPPEQSSKPGDAAESPTKSSLQPPFGNFDKYFAQVRSSSKRDVRTHISKTGVLRRQMILQDSQKVVLFAMGTNFTLFTLKLAAALGTGSSSMFSEAFHSFADVCNECLLVIGIRRSLRDPDAMHPYGYQHERYAWALISGVGIFFLGCGVSIYHGCVGILNPVMITNTAPAFYVLGAALALEGATAVYAFRKILKSARAAGVKVIDFVQRGADPTAVQVLLEDCAGVTGVLIAGTCIGLTNFTGNPIFDPIGSLLIGTLLGGVAVFLIRRNIAGLVETSMAPDRLKYIVGVIEADPIVRSVHDVKSTCLGPDFARFKCEINFNGREVSRRYIHHNKSIMPKEFEEMEQIRNQRDMEDWLTKHGAGIVHQLGEEVDRLEVEIRKRAPEIKHVDLEIL